MIFWILGYIVTLVLVGLQSTVLFQCVKENKKLAAKILFPFGFVLCSNLFALSMFAIKATKFLSVSETTQVLIITLGGIPLFVVIWLGMPLRSEDTSTD